MDDVGDDKTYISMCRLYAGHTERTDKRTNK